MKPSDVRRGIRADGYLPRTLIVRMGNLLGADARFLGVLGACLVACLVGLAILGPGTLATRRFWGGIKVGTIADRDISAGKAVAYVDAEATRLRMAAEERLVLPVFTLDSDVSARNLARLREFRDFVQGLVAGATAEDSLVLMTQSRFPGAMDRESILALVRSPLRAQVFLYADSILETLQYRGVFHLPPEGLDKYNPDYLELRRQVNEKIESTEQLRARMVTLDNLVGEIEQLLVERRLTRPLEGYVVSIVTAFCTENAFFDEEQSGKRLARARESVEPVLRTVGRDELLVRKGEMVTEAAFARFSAVRQAVSRADWRYLLSGIGLLLTTAIFGILVLSKEGLYGSALERGYGYLAMGSSVVFFFTVLIAGRLVSGGNSLDGAFILPVSLFAGLGAAVSGTRFGVLYSLLLALLASAGTGMNPQVTLLVLLSGIAAGLSVSTATSRIQLVKAAVMQAGLQALLAALLTVQGGSPPERILGFAALQAANGFIGGSLLLGILPILEQTLNIPTRFRLMELSDLNSPLLKQLLVMAPGTYSHSINVAHLAESAAREIGADPQLARVGAYYHDIGKLEQPEYFVENQEGVNKHDDLNPRLSATVIRSHVKLGSEKARELGLPQAVVDIVAQHHGNSLIVWFYEKARKLDPSARAEDFSYPGEPPASREAGVVMLADSVEASTRTLKKPTLPRLEEFIRQVIMDKVATGQLDNCKLTLKDLETIRHSFTRILSGHFHSRIEYPKAAKEQKR